MKLSTKLLATCFLISTTACAGTQHDATPASLEDNDAAVHSAHTDSVEMRDHDFKTTSILSDDSSPEGQEFPDQKTVYTSREVFVDPTLSAACGWEKPTIYFKTDSADVALMGDVRIDLLATCLNNEALADEPVNITGYADPRGTDDYNRELGLDRANAVAAELAKHKVNKKRITTYSRGEHKANEDSEAYGMDRKVVIKLDR